MFSPQVFKLCYCHSVRGNDLHKYHSTVKSFVECVHASSPEMQQKVKIHLLLHLPDNMVDFGPPSNYNTERYVWPIILLHVCVLM